MATYQANTIADMRALSPGNGEDCEVAGYYSANDWDTPVAGHIPPKYQGAPPNRFVYNSTSTAIKNDITIFEPTSGTGRWFLQYDGKDYISSGNAGIRVGDDSVAASEENKEIIQKWWRVCVAEGKIAWHRPGNNDDSGIIYVRDGIAIYPDEINGLRYVGIRTIEYLPHIRYVGTQYENKEFPFVDESMSSVIHKSSNPPTGTGSLLATGIWFLHTPGVAWNDVIFDGACLNNNWLYNQGKDYTGEFMWSASNFNNSGDWEVLERRTQSSNILYSSNTTLPFGPDGIIFKNHAMYNSGWNAGTGRHPNIRYRNGLYYFINSHSTGGYTDIENLEKHHVAVGIAPEANPTRMPGHTSDPNRMPSRLVGLHAFQGGRGIKFPNSSNRSYAPVYFENIHLERMICSSRVFWYNVGDGNGQTLHAKNVLIKDTIPRYNGNTNYNFNIAQHTKRTYLKNFTIDEHPDVYVYFAPFIKRDNGTPVSHYNGDPTSYAHFFADGFKIRGTQQTTSGVIFRNPDNLGSGFYYWNGGECHLTGGTYHIRLEADAGLVLSNVDFISGSVIRVESGCTLKYSKLTGGYSFSGSGTFIQLPEVNNLGVADSGSDMILSCDATTPQSGRSISGVKFYREINRGNFSKEVPEFDNYQVEYEELGSATNTSGNTWEYTWTGMAGANERIFAIVTDNENDESLPPRDENGDLTGLITGEGLSKVVLSSPGNTATGVSVNPILSWSSVVGADFYELEYADNDTLTNSTAVDNIEALEHQLSNLDNSETYYWRVRAKTSSAEGDWSDTWSFTTEAATEDVPGNVTRTFPSNGATDISLNPTLTWDATDGANKYQLTVWVSGEDPIVDNEELGNVTEYALTNLDAGKTYNWNIRAGNDAGWGNWTGAWTFTVESAIQTLSVESDIALGNWTVTEATDGADALASLDDVSYIGTDVVDGDPYIGKLSSSGKQLPSNKEGWQIRNIRARKTGELLFVSIYEYDDGGDFNLTNYNNNKTLIEKIEIENLTDSFSNVDVNISEAGSITDIHDLYIQLSFESGGA